MLRVVLEEGNAAALALMDRVFVQRDTFEWRARSIEHPVWDRAGL